MSSKPSRASKRVAASDTAAQVHDALAHRVAQTAVALLHHDDACRDFACVMSDGCPERQALMEAHNEATNDYEEALSRV